MYCFGNIIDNWILIVWRKFLCHICILLFEVFFLKDSHCVPHTQRHRHTLAHLCLDSGPSLWTMRWSRRIRGLEILHPCVHLTMSMSGVWMRHVCLSLCQNFDPLCCCCYSFHDKRACPLYPPRGLREAVRRRPLLTTTFWGFQNVVTAGLGDMHVRVFVCACVRAHALVCLVLVFVCLAAW